MTQRSVSGLKTDVGNGLDLRSQALLISQGNSRADSWEVALFAGLGDKAGEYEKVYISPPSILISFQK